MNRPIKFRAWDTRLKKMFPDVYVFHDMVWIGTDYPKERAFRIPECIPMQFTGLKDKNGKEIYEGDIVVQEGYPWFDDGKPNYRGTVEWIYSQWQVIQHCANPDKRGISDGINVGLNDPGLEEGEKSDWEVIGNIYENPELLK